MCTEQKGKTDDLYCERRLWFHHVHAQCCNSKEVWVSVLQCTRFCLMVKFFINLSNVHRINTECKSSFYTMYVYGCA